MTAIEKPVAKPVEKSLALTKNPIVNGVMAKISELQAGGKLCFPKNYSPENALMGAYLALQAVKDKDGRPALVVCTPESIANSLLDMVIQGLNVQKKQGYFIVFGGQVVFLRSYFGTMAVTKRVMGCQDIFAAVVYEGDEFEYALVAGNKCVTKHTQKLANVAKDRIVAAYCVIVAATGETSTGIMTLAQIHQAWRQSTQNPFEESGKLKPGAVHAKFPEDMAMKTVINRTCKKYINSSMDDSLALVVHHMNRCDDAAEEAEFAEEVAQHANSQLIDAEFTPSAEPAPGDKPVQATEAPPAQPTLLTPPKAPAQSERRRGF
jgi:recombination protein RecT